ncbi:MAG TPA: hypothetical protein VHC23_05245, partial [Jatrophihabitans sp.]|nr:hypothetical protein [Jatrophihabitans sp.]
MVRLAWRMLTRHPAGMISAFLALAVAMTVVTACGVLLESGIRYHGTAARYGAAPVVVATTDVSITEGSGEDADTEHVALDARAALPTALVAAIGRRPGVGATIADTEVAGTLAGRSGAGVQLHPWSAAQLAPYRLQGGHAPRHPGEAVVAGSGRLGQRLTVLLPGGPRSVTVVGVAAGPRLPAGEPATIFLPDAEVARLAGGAVQ